MYKCMDCGHLFEEGEQKTWKEDRGEYWGSTCYEEMSGCPFCGGAYEEIEKCQICDRYIFPKSEDNLYCDECKKNVSNRLQIFLDNNFTSEERRLLNELYDGEEL